MVKEQYFLNQHPCLNSTVSRWFTCVHLPVAAGCNIKCRYCSREYDCINENTPGIRTKIFTPREALKRVHDKMRQDERVRVVGVAGPGEPLASKETLDALVRVHQRFPHLIKCVSTNGLMLEENIDLLLEAGVKVVTVTVNAVDPEVGRRIYNWVFYGNKPHFGIEGAELLLKKQLAGIREAAKRGILIKVNTILIPGINDFHLKQVALTVKEAGAYIMKVIPIVPHAEFSLIKVPSGRTLHRVKLELASIIRQTDTCVERRSDAAKTVKITR